MELTNITEIIKLCIELLVVIATSLVIPWIKENTEEKKRKKVLAYVDVAVKAAEQIAKTEGWDGEAKKSWVIRYLEGLGFAIDYDTVDAMIEASVLRIHDEIAY